VKGVIEEGAEEGKGKLFSLNGVVRVRWDEYCPHGV
jgi:hypothetical protein